MSDKQRRLVENERGGYDGYLIVLLKENQLIFYV